MADNAPAPPSEWTIPERAEVPRHDLAELRAEYPHADVIPVDLG
jgi:hypothetical protein